LCVESTNLIKKAIFFNHYLENLIRNITKFRVVVKQNLLLFQYFR
jgi:hypothetical protein